MGKLDEIEFNSISDIDQAITDLLEAKRLAEEFEASQDEFNRQSDRDYFEQTNQPTTEAEPTENQDDQLIRLTGEVIAARLTQPGKLTSDEMYNLSALSRIRLDAIYAKKSARELLTGSTVE